MELICTIVEQQKPREVTYTDKNGKQKTFPSVCVVLRCGGDWIACEATYELAENLVKNPLQTRTMYMARLVWRTSDYTDSNGASRTRCEAKLMSIVEM